MKIYRTLAFILIAPTLLWGQTSWQSVTNLPNYSYYQGYSGVGGSKLRFIDGDFILAWAERDYNQSFPTLNYARLDMHGSDHQQTVLEINPYFHWFYGIFLSDFTFTDDGRAVFSIYDDWYYGSAIAIEADNGTVSVSHLNQNYPSFYRRAMWPSSLAYGNNLLLSAYSSSASPYGYPYFYSWYDPLPPAMYFSSNGLSWSESSLFSGLNVNEIVFDGEQFMAVGYYIPQSYYYLPMNSVGVILSSQDGLDWTFTFLHESTSLVAVTRTTDSWIAVGVNGVIYRLDNGIWVRHHPTGNISGVTSLARIIHECVSKG